MSDWLETHTLDGDGRKCRTATAATVEDKLLVLREQILVHRALRINVELEHTARCVHGTWNHALFRLAGLANVNEHDAVVIDQIDRLRGRDLLDLAVSFRKELLCTLSCYETLWPPL